MSNDQLSPSAFDRPKPRLSIRARLMLVALLAVVPLMLDRVRILESTRSLREGQLATKGLEAFGISRTVDSCVRPR